MIDFTNALQKNKAYAGANGGKIAVMYNDEQYMLKFPPYPTKNKDMSYTNSCISEYIGCKIFDMLSIPVQETMIGTYTSKNKNELNHRVFDIPLSAITYNGKKINYFKFLSAGKFEECNRALEKIVNRIKMDKVFEIIDNTETITEIQKKFYKTMLTERKKRILDFS